MAKAPNVLNTACQPYFAESPTPIPPRIPMYVQMDDGSRKYSTIKHITPSLEDIEGVYNIEIQNNNDYLKKSLVENLKIMDTTI